MDLHLLKIAMMIELKMFREKLGRLLREMWEIYGKYGIYIDEYEEYYREFPDM